MRVKQIEYYTRIALIAITPIAYGIAFGLFSRQNGPYFLRPNQDPDYAYLVNSLAVANFEIPGHTDHPGTPVQILGGLIIWLSHAVQSLAGQTTLNLNQAVLSNPELYLHTIYYVFLCLNVLGILALGLVMFSASKRLILAILIQLCPLLLVKTILFNDPSRVAPETLLFFLSQILAILLVIYLFYNGVGKTRWFALSLGIVFGLGMATKVTFLPTIIFGFALSGYRRKLWALGAAVIAFIVATLPIVSQYGRVAQWIVNIILKTERYGGGDDIGVPTLSTLKTGLITLVQYNTVFFCLLGILSIVCITSTALIVLYRVKQPPQKLSQGATSRGLRLRQYWLTLWLVLVMWSQTLITVIEYSQSRSLSRYLIPSVGLCGLLLVLIVIWIEATPIYKNWIPPSIPIACMLIYVLCLGLSIQEYDVYYDQMSSRSTRYLQKIQEIERLLSETPKYKECFLVLERNASNIRSALFYGNEWANWIFAKTLDELYPNSVFLNSSASDPSVPLKFQQYSGSTLPATELLAEGNGCILFQSRGGVQDQISKDAAAERLIPNGFETVYRLHF